MSVNEQEALYPRCPSCETNKGPGVPPSGEGRANTTCGGMGQCHVPVVFEEPVPAQLAPHLDDAAAGVHEEGAENATGGPEDHKDWDLPELEWAGIKVGCKEKRDGLPKPQKSRPKLKRGAHQSPPPKKRRK